MKKTISFFSLFMLLATNFMPLVSFANEGETPMANEESVDEEVAVVNDTLVNDEISLVEETLVAEEKLETEEMTVTAANPETEVVPVTEETSASAETLIADENLTTTESSKEIGTDSMIGGNDNLITTSLNSINDGGKISIESVESDNNASWCYGINDEGVLEYFISNDDGTAIDGCPQGVLVIPEGVVEN